ncbi:unnamed protein product, partial [marine sediment metagenome]
LNSPLALIILTRLTSYLQDPVVTLGKGIRQPDLIDGAYATDRNDPYKRTDLQAVLCCHVKGRIGIIFTNKS